MKKIFTLFLSGLIIFTSTFSSFANDKDDIIVPHTVTPTLMSTIYAIGQVCSTALNVACTTQMIIDIGYSIFYSMTPEQQQYISEYDLSSDDGYYIDDEFIDYIQENVNLNLELQNGLIINQEFTTSLSLFIKNNFNHGDTDSMRNDFIENVESGSPLYSVGLHAQGLPIKVYASACSSKSNPRFNNICLAITYNGQIIREVVGPYYMTDGKVSNINCQLKYGFAKNRNGSIYFYTIIFDPDQGRNNVSLNTLDVLNISTEGYTGKLNTANINKSNVDRDFNNNSFTDSIIPPGIEIPNDKPEEIPNNKVPEFPSLDDIDFSGFDFSSLGSLFENFKNKFPFSLPFDLHNILSSFSVDPEAPIFEVPLFSESITIDLTQFNELANIIRMFVIIGWVIGLFILTKTFGG